MSEPEPKKEEVPQTPPTPQPQPVPQPAPEPMPQPTPTPTPNPEPNPVMEKPLPDNPKEREKVLVNQTLDLLYKIRKGKLLYLEDLVKKQEELITLDAQMRTKLEAATDGLTVKKYKEIIVSIGLNKVILQEKRHIVKLMEIEEAKLKARLIELEIPESG